MGKNDKFTYAFSTVPAEIMSGEDKVTPSQTFVDRRTGQQFEAPGLQPTPVSVSCVNVWPVLRLSATDWINSSI